MQLLCLLFFCPSPTIEHNKALAKKEHGSSNDSGSSSGGGGDKGGGRGSNSGGGSKDTISTPKSEEDGSSSSSRGLGSNSPTGGKVVGEPITGGDGSTTGEGIGG